VCSDRQASFLPAIYNLVDITKALGTEAQNKVDKTRVEILEVLESWRDGQNDAAFSTLSSSLMNLVEQSRTSRNVYVFLKSLHFKQIKARQFEVKTAHANTFKWIFDGSSKKQQFARWLRCSSGIFWICGKAGSGKSTLMKFLADNDRLRSSLDGWAGGLQLLIASHFFWNAGTTMQKSQEGLLRTLLFQILVHSPDLISTICPNRWMTESADVTLSSLEPWSLPELSQALEAIASLDHLPVRLCLLIDGLDEYDGDHSEIIRVIKTMAKSPHIKLCVSSRPWTVFVDAFDNGEWKLYLQDLTRNDIRLYIKDVLEENADFRDLKSREAAGSENLVKEIVSKAQGVFLWVYLVVRSLLRGLTNRDDMSDLTRRLAKLPGHLETYFKHMLDTIEDVYQQQTAQTFQVMANASTMLPLIALHFMDHEKDDPDYALQLEIGSISHSKFVAMVDTRRRQLNARCRDLVEVTEDKDEPFFFKYGVCFLHRTVMDFLRTTDMETLMRSRSGPDFNPNLALCRAYLAQAKALPAVCESKNTILRNLILGTIYYARQIEILNGMEATAILDELHNTLVLFAHENHIKREEVFSQDEFDSILGIAVRAGLQLYVRQKTKNYPEILQSLLLRGLQTSVSIYKDSTFEFYSTSTVDLSMLRLLLDLGASPSDSSLHPETKRSIWEHFIYEQSSRRERFSSRRDPVPSQWDMTKFLKPDGKQTKWITNLYDVFELVILHEKGKGLYFPAAKAKLQQLFVPDQANRLWGLLKADKKRFELDLRFGRKYRLMGQSASWWNPLGYFS
jgi:hypothetical protein